MQIEAVSNKSWPISYSNLLYIRWVKTSGTYSTLQIEKMVGKHVFYYFLFMMWNIWSLQNVIIMQIQVVSNKSWLISYSNLLNIRWVKTSGTYSTLQIEKMVGKHVFYYFLFMMWNIWSLQNVIIMQIQVVSKKSWPISYSDLLYIRWVKTSGMYSTQNGLRWGLVLKIRYDL